MKKLLLLCLNMSLVVPIVAARPILTKEKWQQMQQDKLQDDQIVPETRPMFIEDVEDEGIEELDQTPPPLPPRPVTPPPLPPRPIAQQPMMTGVTKEQAAQGEPVPALTKPGLPFTGQDLATQAGKLKKPTDVQPAAKEPLNSFKQQLESKFKGASGVEDEPEDEWEE